MKKKKLVAISKHTVWLRYLRGQLSESESYDLENSLMKDGDALSALQAIAQDELSTSEMEDDLSDIQQRWKNRSTAKRRTIQPWVGKVAAVLFLGFGIWAAMIYYQDQQGSALYADYFESDSYLAVRGENDDDPNFTKALEAYQAENYENSFTQFQYLKEQTSNDVQTHLYAALSAMQLGKNFEAKQILREINTLDVNKIEKAPAHWYLALIYLQENNDIDCKKELQWLLENTPNGQWGSHADKLMKELLSKK